MCAAGQVAFLPTILLLRGRWRRSQTLGDRTQHERQTAAKMAMLVSVGGGAALADVVGGIPARQRR
jgi:hypothetical protein